MRRMKANRQEPTNLLFRRIGLPSWVLYTLTVHFWAVLIAAKVSGASAVIMTVVTPVISWFYWGLSLTGDLKFMADLFDANLLAWLISTALVFAASRANRR